MLFWYLLVMLSYVACDALSSAAAKSCNTAKNFPRKKEQNFQDRSKRSLLGRNVWNYRFFKVKRLIIELEVLNKALNKRFNFVVSAEFKKRNVKPAPHCSLIEIRSEQSSNIIETYVHLHAFFLFCIRGLYLLLVK